MWIEVLNEDVLASGDTDAIYDMVTKILWSNTPTPLEDLHQLLADDRHRQHQLVVRQIQQRADPSSVPHLQDALRLGFDRYDYTGSENGVIAKWFSHALADIGTREAVEVLNLFMASADPELSEEMRYRLSKLELRRK